MPNLLRQEGTRGGGELVGELANLFAGDLLAIIGGLADHELHLGVRLGRLHEGPLGEVVDAGLLQNPLAEHLISGFRQLDQGIGPGLADLLLAQPLQETAAAGIATAAFAVPDAAEDPAAPDLGLQVEPVADRPGLLDPSHELHRADAFALGIWQVEAEGGGLGHGETLDGDRWCHVS